VLGAQAEVSKLQVKVRKKANQFSFLAVFVLQALQNNFRRVLV